MRDLMLDLSKYIKYVICWTIDFGQNKSWNELLTIVNKHLSKLFTTAAFHLEHMLITYFVMNNTWYCGYKIAVVPLGETVAICTILHYIGIMSCLSYFERLKIGYDIMNFS